MHDMFLFAVSLLLGLVVGGAGVAILLRWAHAGARAGAQAQHDAAIAMLEARNTSALQTLKTQNEAVIESARLSFTESAARTSRSERDDLLLLAKAQSDAAIELFKAQNASALESAKASFAESAATASRGHRDDLLTLTKAQITPILEPIAQRLEDLNKYVAAADKDRATGYAALAAVMESVMKQNQTLGDATTLMSNKTDALVGALNGSQVRGRWAEVKLRNIIESAGMSAWSDFIEQTSAKTGDAGRPDITVRLPGNRFVFIDAKAPMIAYQNGQDGTNEIRAAELRREHAKAVKAHVDELGRRAYHQTENSLAFTVMFLPTEPLLLTAMAELPDLWDNAMAKGVMLCSPIMLMPLLRMFATGWRQQQQDEQAREIARLGAELYKRLTKFVGFFNAVGQSIATLNIRYNEAAGSMSARLLPQAQRVHKAAALADDEIPEPLLIDAAPRQIVIAESEAA